MYFRYFLLNWQIDKYGDHYLKFLRLIVLEETEQIYTVYLILEKYFQNCYTHTNSYIEMYLVNPGIVLY